MRGVGSEDFRNSADPRGDDRHSGCGGLQNDIGQGFGARGDHQDAAKRKARSCWFGADKSNAFGHAEVPCRVLEGIFVCARADDRCGHVLSVCCKPRERLNKDIDAFERAQLTDKDKIGRVGVRRDA